MASGDLQTLKHRHSSIGIFCDAIEGVTDLLESGNSVLIPFTAGTRSSVFYPDLRLREVV